MEVTSLGYRTDLDILHLGGSEIEDRGDHIVVRSAHAPTYWWGNFLLFDRPRAHQESASVLEQFATVFPHATHVAVGFDGTAGSLADLAWFTARGFSTEALAVMTAAELHEPAHANDAATIRALRSDADWAASVQLRARCASAEDRAVSSNDFDVARARTNRSIVDAGHGSWFGAFVEDQLVAQLGIITTGGGVARYQSVETDPAHRRQGLAATLVQHAGSQALTQLGASTLVIVADPTREAMRLYQSLGFAATETQLIVERAPAEPSES